MDKDLSNPHEQSESEKKDGAKWSFEFHNKVARDTMKDPISYENVLKSNPRISMEAPTMQRSADPSGVFTTYENGVKTYPHAFFPDK